jgi:polar amino acid transport system ATP-binding protein
MSKAYIVCRDVRKRFGEHEVLKGVSTEFQTGQVTVIIGASGSGKSTLLRAINRLEPHDSGSITIDGVEVSDDQRTLQKQRSEVGMVFQQFNLFGHMSVLDNVTLAPRRIRRTPRTAANEQAMVLLKRVGMQDHAHKYPWQLSGGQQQRVAIARSLANRPDLLLADEPTGALDTKTSEDVLKLFSELNAEGLTLAIVTHDPDVANVAHRRITFRDGLVISDEHGEARP